MRIIPPLPFTLRELASATGGTLQCKDRTVTHITTDTRNARSGDLFIALNDTANSFIRSARNIGCSVLSKTSDADIEVGDIECALLDIAKYQLTRLGKLTETICVTGSVGKTSTKEFLRILLREKFRVHANIMNYNNALGVFHTVLSAPPETEILICELGMNHAGEISRMSRALSPTVAVITNVGYAHVGHLGNREGIAAAKLEIRDGMTNGVIFVPDDEPLLNKATGKLTVSLAEDCGDYRLHPSKSTESSAQFDFFSNELTLTDACVNVRGDHYLSCLSFAVAISAYFKLSAQEITNGLKHVSSNVLRQKRLQVGKYDIYDDTYSSSPESVTAVIRSMQLYSSRYSCVLGDMLELGDDTERLHELIGEEAARRGTLRLYTFGTHSRSISRGAIRAGMSEHVIFNNEDISAPEITAEQIKSSYDGELLLIKGSHAVHTERIIALLSEDVNG